MLSRVLLLFLALLGCQTSSPFTYTGQKLKGVNLVAPPRRSGPDALKAVKTIGGEWVAIVPYGFTRKGEARFHFSGNMGEDAKWQWWGETPEGVAATVRMAREQGLKVMLKPHVWMEGGSHLDLEFSREQDWQTFENDYAQYVLHFANMADSLNIDLYCITTELDRFAIARPDFWNNLIKQVRQVYKGKLTYAANWDRYERIPFWKELDYIGVDAYFPLSDEREPDVRTLTKGWQQHLESLKAVSYQHQKPILFTEFGYRSCDHTAERPWESETDCNPNPDAQAKAYEALLTEVWSQPWFAGGFAWKWFMNNEHGRREKDQYSPQGKLAEAVLREKWE